MKIRFLGAADGVTGSRHLVGLAGQRVLLDCGLFQGFKVQRERNWSPLPRDMLDADAVVLTDEVSARSEGAGGVVLFTLHAGAEVTVRERVGAQALIALPDDRVGWVPLDTLGLVDPRLPFPSPPAKPAG